MTSSKFTKPLCVLGAAIVCSAILAAANPGAIGSVANAFSSHKDKDAASRYLPGDRNYLYSPQECGGL